MQLACCKQWLFFSCFLEIGNYCLFGLIRLSGDSRVQVLCFLQIFEHSFFEEELLILEIFCFHHQPLQPDSQKKSASADYVIDIARCISFGLVTVRLWFLLFRVSYCSYLSQRAAPGQKGKMSRRGRAVCFC